MWNFHENRRVTEMKQCRNKGIAFFLSMIMCLSFITPVHAANHTAVLTPNTTSVSQSSTDQTVNLTLDLSGTVTCSAFQFKTKTLTDISVVGVSLNGTELEAGVPSTNAAYKTILWRYNGNQVTTSTLGTIQVKIPANTPAGNYPVEIESGSVVFGSGDTVTSVSGAIIQVTEAADDPVVSDGSYTASVSAPASATVGDTDVEFAIQVSGDSFAAAQLAFTYDHSRLSLVKVAPGSWNEAADGTVTVIEYGTKKTTPHTYTATFTALSHGRASVTLNNAYFGNAESAESENAAAADITVASASVLITNRIFNVTLPQIFIGEKTVEEGADYTFKPADDIRYEYKNVKVSVNGGEAVPLIAAADGSYTVEDVAGDLVITGTRTEKSYTITFETGSGVSVPDPDTVTYGTDYQFDIPEETNYDVTITSMKIGKTDVEYTVSDGVVTIPGEEIIGDIVVTMDRKRNNATVILEGTASGLLSGNATAKPGEDFTVTLDRDDRYAYVVVATINGEEVDLTQNGDAYTIAGNLIKAGDNIEFSVEKTLRTDKLSVERYLQVDGAALYLVKNSVTREDKNVYIYDSTEMFWSEEYNAYCCLVVADTLDEAKSGVLELKTGTDAALTYSMDANQSGKVDINDAQFVYNLYNAQYSGFTAVVTMEKMLYADINCDGVVNVNDAQLIVNNILGK